MVKAKSVPPLSENDKIRFWSKVSFSTNVNICWEWCAKTVDKDGYGRMFLKDFDGSETHIRANRIAYYLGTNENPNSLVVCHKCDNPKCCNPTHLFLGTSIDNRSDCVKKGRQAKGETHGTKTKPETTAKGERNGKFTHPESILKGESHGMAKLTEIQVKAIIEEYKNSKITQTQLAKKYGVHQVQISYMVSGKTWKNIQR